MDPSQLNAKSYEDLLDKHFTMDQKEFNDTVVKANQQTYKAKFGKELVDGYNFIKELYDERKEIEPYYIETQKDFLNDFLDRVTDKTKHGDFERFENDFKDNINFLGLDTSSPQNYEKDFLYHAPALRIVNELIHYLGARKSETKYLQKNDMLEFFNKYGKRIARQMPDERTMPSSLNWETFKPYYDDDAPEVQFDMFDYRSYELPDPEHKHTQAQLNADAVKWALQTIKRYMGVELAWAGAEDRPLLDGYGREENMVDGAAFPYSDQRARDIEAITREITDQIDKPDFVDQYHKYPKYLRRQDTESNEIKFNIEQMIDHYGKAWGIKHFKNIKNAQFITMKNLRELEEATIKNNKAYNLAAEVNKNEELFNKTMEAFSGGDQEYQITPEGHVVTKSDLGWKPSEQKHRFFTQYYVQPKEWRDKDTSRMNKSNEGLGPAEEIYKQLTTAALNEGGKINNEFLGFEIDSPDYDFIQAPVANSLKEDHNFILNVLRAVEYADCSKEQLKSALSNRPDLLEKVENMRHFFKGFSATDYAYHATKSENPQENANYIGERMGRPNDYFGLKEDTFTRKPLKYTRKNPKKGDYMGHDPEQVMRELVDLVMVATGRDTNYKLDKYQKELQHLALTENPEVPLLRRQTETSSKKDYNDPFMVKEQTIGQLSLEEGQQIIKSARARPVRVPMAHSTMPMPMPPGVKSSTPISEVHSYNEQRIGNIAKDDVDTPSFLNISANGEIKRPGQFVGRGESKQEAYEEKPIDKFENKYEDTSSDSE